jgi:hypothetical protein
MEEYTGSEHNVFEPLGGHHKGIRWARWEGFQGEMGGKEIRLTRNHRAAKQEFSWPVVEENARALWQEDGSRCVERGRYVTQLVSYGSAPRWKASEVAMARQALEKHGVKVSGVKFLRGLSFGHNKKKKAPDTEPDTEPD